MRITDAALPAAPELLGPSADALLRAALGAAGGHLVEARPVQVLYRPGRELVVRYDATVGWGDGAAPRREALVAATTPQGAPPGTLPLEADGIAVGLWRFPHDPSLPGLALATCPSAAAALLASRGPVALEVRSYRPGQRAVVQARLDGAEAYLKVVPPAELGPLVARHRLLARHAPVPEVLAADEARGVVALAALPGEDLRDRLRRAACGRPSPAAVAALLDGLAEAPLEVGPPVRGALAAVGRHADLLAAVLPEVADRTERLTALLGADDVGLPRAVVHGDLHEAQLRVAGGRIVGLLDLDGVGRGHRVDDVANLLGHLATLALGSGGARATTEAYVEHLRVGLVDRGGRAELDRRVAAVVLGLATGPFRVQRPRWAAETAARIGLAERWARRAPADRPLPAA